MQDSKTTQTV